jgi:hypothetical protein
MSSNAAKTTALPTPPKGKKATVEGVSVQFEEITPELATKMLEHNTANRNVRDVRVAALVRDIENGDFQSTHQGVAFNASGELIDGQHRLWAVVRSGKTVTMMVTRGLTEEAKPAIDTGAKRTFGDLLQFSGKTNRNVLASIVRMHLLYDREVPMGSYAMTVTETEMMHHLEEHEEDFTTAAKLALAWKGHISAPPQVIGTAWLIFNEIDPEQAKEFFTDMVNMTTRGEGDSRVALMNRLRRRIETNEKVPAAMMLSMFIKAWNNYRTGTPTTVIPRDKLKTKKVLEAV